MHRATNQVKGFYAKTNKPALLNILVGPTSRGGYPRDASIKILSATILAIVAVIIETLRSRLLPRTQPFDHADLGDQLRLTSIPFRIAPSKPRDPVASFWPNTQRLLGLARCSGSVSRALDRMDQERRVEFSRSVRRVAQSID